MSAPDVTQAQNARAGAALRKWREAQKPRVTLASLTAKLAAVMNGRLPSVSLVAKWERGEVVPGDAYYTALAQIGAPVDGWRPPTQATGPLHKEGAQGEAIDRAQAEVQRMLAEGRPLAEVYAVASRALALTLSGGLSPDRQRAWQMLVRTLREGSAEAGKIPPLERHPDWSTVVELLLDAVQGLPGGSAAVLAAVKRSVAEPPRRAAA